MPYKDPQIRRIKARMYGKLWRSRHRERSRAIGRSSWRRNGHKWKRRTKEQLAAYAREYRRRIGQKNVAYWKVKDALQAGKLQKPILCGICNQAKKLQAHHHKGYAKEFWLDVVWLCIKCHNAEHLKLRRESPSRPAGGDRRTATGARARNGQG